MNIRTRLRLTAEQDSELHAHLYPGDDNEAVALVLCGRRSGEGCEVLTVHEVFPIPYGECLVRTPVRVTWPSQIGVSLYKRAMRNGMAVLKIHSHPGGYADFSEWDNQSDRELFESLHGWTDDGLPHASAVMLPDRRIFGRMVAANLDFQQIERVMVVGDEITFHDVASSSGIRDDRDLRNSQAFGPKTVNQLRSMTVGVVGCSGTGSWVVEQLARLGVGQLVLVDPEVIENKNLNRIVNSSIADAQARSAKVDVMRSWAERMGMGTQVVSITASVESLEVMKKLASCDVLFGCMDKMEGRNTLNRLATFYSLPYFDVGVRLDADGKGGVDVVCGSVHYLLPGGSSLLSRGVINPEGIRADVLRRTNPEQYADELERGYIHGAKVESPAVTSVNGLCASMAVNNLLARIHAFRIDPNNEIRHQWFDLVNGVFGTSADGERCASLAKYVGRGDMDPFLNTVWF